MHIRGRGGVVGGGGVRYNGCGVGVARKEGRRCSHRGGGVGSGAHWVWCGKAKNEGGGG